MTIKLAETLVKDVQTYLSTNFTAKVAALNAEYADGITLVVPVAYYQAEQSLEAIPAYPAVFLLVPHSDFTSWNQFSIEASHVLSVGIIVMEQDTETLRKLLFRYIRAIIELLITSQTSINWALDVGETQAFNADFSPVYANGETFMADAQISASWKSRNLEQF